MFNYNTLKLFFTKQKAEKKGFNIIQIQAKNKTVKRKLYQW